MRRLLYSSDKPVRTTRASGRDVRKVDYGEEKNSGIISYISYGLLR